jgi:hypothetical protein
MSRKQSTPRQLHLLREAKRKATAEQEERLQLALARLAQQGNSLSKSKTQHHLRISPDPSIDKYYAVRRGRVNNIIYTSWLYPGAEYKSFTKYEQATAYLQAKGHRIQPAPLIPGTSLGSEGDTDVNSSRIDTIGTQTAEPELEVNPVYRKFKIASLGFILGVIATLWILLLLSPTRMR